MQRLSKHQRLARPADYRRVYQSNYWGNTRLFSFNVQPIEVRDGPSILGTTVSKKVSKSAVKRNKIKRQIKEFYRLHQQDLVGCEVVITAKASASQATQAERWADLTELWAKLLKWQRWYHRNHTQQASEQPAAV